jgi:hypothetical protein
MLDDWHMYKQDVSNFTFQVIASNLHVQPARRLEKTMVTKARREGKQPYNRCAGHPPHSARWQYCKDRGIL